MNLPTSPARPLRLLLALAALPALLLASDAPQPTVITSDQFDMKGTDTETTSVFDGHVTLTGTGMRLECNHLVVVSARVGDKADTVGEQDRFKLLVATGNVRLVQGEREAKCGKAEVRFQEDRITLTENPVVIDHGNKTEITGDELFMNRGDRLVHGTNIKMTGPSLRDLGFDPTQPPPQPGAQKKAPSP